jgi:hypothetical protein
MSRNASVRVWRRTTQEHASREALSILLEALWRAAMASVLDPGMPWGFGV